MSKLQRKQLRDKAKRTKPVTRLSLPSNKRFKSKRDYKRKNKVKVHELEKD